MSDIPVHQWVFRSRPGRTIDGDTFVADAIDLGFGVMLRPGNEGAHVRLLGVDCPERNEPGWDEARDYTKQWMVEAGDGGEWSLLIESIKADSFGRYLARVWRVADGRCLNDDLIESGLAVPYVR